MDYWLIAEKSKNSLDHFFYGVPCPLNIIQTITHWKNTYWNLAPQDDFDCDLLVNHLLDSKIADFMLVMFFDSFIKNIEDENSKTSFLNDTQKVEIDRIKQFIVQSKL